MLDTNTIQDFQTKILNRYALNKRDLPWRDCGNPYRIFVSEVMLQQTQVDRVIPKFLQFVEAVPDFESLSILRKHDLLRLWSWLWFNARALRLQQTAQIIVQEYGGVMPESRKILLSFPGIWAYTSASLLAFVYNIAVPVIDTNIRRVLIRELWLEEGIDTKQLEAIALSCIPSGKSGEWHHALMDYGALVCTAKVTGIKPLSKQSTFKWSDREVRWRILKELVADRVVTIERIQKNFPVKDAEKIVFALVKEGMLCMERDGEIRVKN